MKTWIRAKEVRLKTETLIRDVLREKVTPVGILVDSRNEWEEKAPGVSSPDWLGKWQLHWKKRSERPSQRQKSNDKDIFSQDNGRGKWNRSKKMGWPEKTDSDFRGIYTEMTAKAGENAQFIKLLWERKATAQQGPIECPVSG